MGEVQKPLRKGSQKQEIASQFADLQNKVNRFTKLMVNDEGDRDSAGDDFDFEEDNFLSVWTTEQELQRVWQSSDMISYLDNFQSMGGDLDQLQHWVKKVGIDMDGSVSNGRKANAMDAMDLLQLACNSYSNLVVESQLEMIPQALVDSGLANPDPYMEVGNVGVGLDELEEPLSWRPLANDLGLRAIGLDIYLWRNSHDQMEAQRSAKGRGFGAAGRGEKGQKVASVETLEALPESDEKYRWLLIGKVAEMVTLAYSALSIRPRIVCSSRLAKSLQEPDFQRINELLSGFDIRSFSGRRPPSDLLVSDSQCAVLLVLEEPVLTPGDDAWSVATADSLDGPIEDPENYAPVVVLSLMQHSVELNCGAFTKKAMPVLKQLLAEGIAAEQDTILNNFLQPLFNAAMPDRSSLKAAAQELQERVAPVIRQGYASSFSRLRSRRLAELEKAKAHWQAEDERRRELQARRERALRGLTEAAEILDTQLFAKAKAEALAEGLLDEEEVAELALGLYAELAAMEEPLRRLVAMYCEGQAQAGPHDLSTDELDAVLAEMRLPEWSPWWKVGKELRAALRGLAALREGAAEVALYNHSNAASHKVALLRGSASLMRGEAKLLHFEATARSAGADVAEAGAAALRQVLEDGREAVTTAERDQALWACLASAPWTAVPPYAAGALELGSVRPADMAELEARATDASGLALSQLGDALQEALEGGRCALALQKALEAEDVRSLEERLQEAQERGIVALEPAELRLGELRELESALARLRAAAAEVSVLLDTSLFEQLLDTARNNDGLELPEEEELRSQLAKAVADAEAALREPLLAAVEDPQGANATAEQLRRALEATRLPDANAWRAAAAAGSAALKAAAGVRRAAAAAASAAREELLEDGEELPCVQTGLAFLEKALGGCESALDALAKEGRKVGEPRLEAAPGLRKAIEEGQVALKGLRADEVLRARLDAVPWSLRPLPLKEAAAGDLEELRQLSDEATIEGLYRVAASLDAALAAGRCARDLCEAMEGDDAEELAARLREAEPLGFSGLEPPRRRLAELEALLEKQRKEAEALREQRRAEAEAAAEAARQRRQRPDAASGGWDDMRWSEAGAESSNMIFLDLELTAGFYEFDMHPRVLEAAVVVTDKDLNEKGRGTWVIGDFSREDLEGLSHFHQAHFRDLASGGPFPPYRELGGYGNGLFADVLKSSLTKEEVEDEMLDLVRKHCPPGACPLSGYSVQCDREVLKLEMPRLYQYVSHQIVDVSSFLRMARLHNPERVKAWDRRAPRYNHRALNDVEDSIDALRWVKGEYFQER